MTEEGGYVGPEEDSPPTRLPTSPILMLVTEPADRLVATVVEAVGGTLGGGVNMVQLRAPGMVISGVWYLAREIRQALRPCYPLVVNARTCAAVVDTDGYHLPDDWPAPAAQLTWDCGLIIGRSVHSVESARRAEQEGADYLLAGTIYESSSHPGQRPAGVQFLGEVCRAVRIPVLAIGGVTTRRIPECVRAGASGVAVISPIMRAAEPREAAEEFRWALETTWYREVVSDDRTEGERRASGDP